MDVINRLEPVIFEIERIMEPLLIIGHQAVLRCLYAYFFDLPAEEIPYVSIPLHTLIRLDPGVFGCQEKRMRIIVEDDASVAPSTHAADARRQESTTKVNSSSYFGGNHSGL